MTPALLVAARAKYLASAAFAQVADQIASTPDWPSAVFTELDPNTGQPLVTVSGKSSVVFYLRPGAWHVNGTSARFPRLGVAVWSTGAPGTHAPEYQARAVAESLITCFDDFANEQNRAWSADVWVAHSRWSGECAVFEAENEPGTYRAEVSFEIETV